MKVIIAAWIFCLMAAGVVFAHDHWINNHHYTDPVHGWACCGDDDCKPSDPSAHEVELVPGKGYLIKETGQIVEFARAIPSETDDDGGLRYYVCRWTFGQEEEATALKVLRCLFIPMGSV